MIDLSQPEFIDTLYRMYADDDDMPSGDVDEPAMPHLHLDLGGNSFFRHRFRSRRRSLTRGIGRCVVVFSGLPVGLVLKCRVRSRCCARLCHAHRGARGKRRSNVWRTCGDLSGNTAFVFGPMAIRRRRRRMIARTSGTSRTPNLNMGLRLTCSTVRLYGRRRNTRMWARLRLITSIWLYIGLCDPWFGSGN